MAIKITREQFEKKFGHPPIIGTTPQQAQTPGFGGEVKSRLSGVAQSMGQQFRGEGEFAGQSDIRKATGVVAQASSVPLGLAKDVLPEFAEQGLEKVGQGVGKGLQWVAEKTTPQFLVDFVTNHPDAAKALEEAAGTVANVGEISGNILGIEGAKQGIVKTAKGIQGASKSLSPVAEATGRVLKRTGEGAYGLTVTPEESTSQAIRKYNAKQPSFSARVKNLVKGTEPEGKPITEANTAARRGLMGTEKELGVQATRVSNELWKSEIQPKLAKVKGEVDMKKFLGEVRKEVSKSPTGIRKTQLLEALDSVDESFKQVNTKINLETLQNYKEDWTQFIPDSAYKGKVPGSALREVQKLMSEKARQVIYKHIGEEGRQAYLDYGNLKSIMKAADKSFRDPAKQSLSRGLWQFVMDKTVTPIATTGGKILYRTGEGLEFVGKKGAKKVKDVID